MAQTIKLRRSSTEGKVPTTAQLALGELAINTYDGRVFFEKNDGSATIQHIVTTNSVTTGSISIVGQLTVDDITINGSTISDGGDFTIEANGDITLDANGADITLSDDGTNWGRFTRASSDFVIKSLSNNNDILFKGVDNSATITALQLDMSDAGTAIFNNNIKVVGNISGSSFNGTGLISGSSQVSHDSTTGFVANEHIDHSSVSITAGTGLNGGGTIASTRTLNVDDDYKNTSLNSFTASNANTSLNAATSSYLTTVDISDDTNLTGGTGITLTGDTLSTTDSEIVHDNLSGFVANEHIDHSSVSITAGTGLNGGGTIASTRTLNVDDDYKNTSLNTFTSSFSAFGLTLIDDANASTARSTLGVDEAGTDNSTNVTLDDSSHNYLSLSGQEITIGQVDISDDTNLAVSDTSEVNMILSGDTLSAELIGGVVSGSSQITNIANSQLAGSIANSKLANSSISIGGISFSLGDTDATPAFDLQDATGYATSNLSGTITNSQLAGSIANGKLSNSAITISGTSVSLGGSISDETLFGGTGVVSGSSQVVTAATVKGALNGNLGTLTLGDSNDTVSIPGNLSVEGTRTFIDSTTLQIGDNIIELNGSGTNDGGIYVRDAEASTTTTGSLIWNTGDDKWTAGPKGSEDDVVLATATQTLTNKTINGSQLVDDSVTNAKLDNSSVSFGGVSVALGSSDSTPAFNLADATGYQTSNLSGTITNSQLAGSIANGKLANSAITIMGTSTSLGGSFTTSDVVSALANTAVSNESLNSATGSFLTAHPNISAGSNISQNNSNGTVLQDLTITLDSNGHVTTATAGTVNLDGRYYTETESDTLYTKKLGQGVVSGSAQIDGASITNKSVSFGGVSVNLGSSDSTPAFNLADATGYQTSNLSGTITNSQLAGSIANGKLSNSAITISGTSVSLGSSISDETLFGGTGVVSGSSQVSLETLTGGSGIQSGSITNADLAGSIANSKLSNSAITIDGTSVSLGGSITTDNTQLSTEQVQDIVGAMFSSNTETRISATYQDGDGTIDLVVDDMTADNNTQNTTTLSFVDSSDDIILRNTTGGAGSGTQDITINAGSNITLTHTDANNITITSTDTNTQLSTSDVRGKFSAGEGIDISSGEISGEDASATNKGIVELATTAETTTGTDSTRAVTPDGLKDGYQGSTNVTTLGTIGTGTWNGSVIASAYLDSDTAHLSGTQTFSGAKTFSNEATFTGGIQLNDNDELTFGDGDDYQIDWDGSQQLFKNKVHGGSTFFQQENSSGTNQNVIEMGSISGDTTKTFVELRCNNAARITTTSDGSTLAGIVSLSSSTSSTSKTTGALVVTGGIGCSGALNVGGDVTAFASSDERYKDLITPIENPNEKIKLLSGNTFVWNDKHEIYKGKKDIGVIAQEVEKVLPEIVETREDGYKAVKYEKIVALLIESNKELIKRVEELESKIK